MHTQQGAAACTMKQLGENSAISNKQEHEARRLRPQAGAGSWQEGARLLAARSSANKCKVGRRAEWSCVTRAVSGKQRSVSLISEVVRGSREYGNKRVMQKSDAKE